jgi:hypothetical protein
MNYGTAEQAIHWILHVCDDPDVYNQVEFLKAWEEGDTKKVARLSRMVRW